LVEIDLAHLESRAIGTSKFGIKDAAVESGRLWAGTRYFLAGRPQREINLLADGCPITFWGAQGMPHEGGDLIMTVILTAAAELAAGNRPKHGSALYPNRICRRAVDESAVKFEIQNQHARCYHPD